MDTKKIILLSLTVLAIASCTSRYEKKPKRIINRGEIVSHRGVCIDSIAPENSLDALIIAKRCGFKYIEIDCEVTADGEWVVIHDETLNQSYRNAKDYSPILEQVYCHKNTLSDLKENYVLISPNPSYRRPISSLTEFLNKCAELNIFPYLDLKWQHLTNEMTLKAYKTANQILGKQNFAITCENEKFIYFLRSIDSEVELYSEGVSRKPMFHKDMIYKNIEYFHEYQAVTPKSVQTFHEAGKSATVWTVPIEKYDELLKLNVDVMLSDDIAPPINPSTLIFTDYTDGTFNNYSGGTKINNIVKLSKEETLELESSTFENIYLGAIYITIESKGAIKIESNKLATEKRSNLNSDFATFYYQFLIHNTKPKFSITALDDSVSIKSIEFKVSKF